MQCASLITDLILMELFWRAEMDEFIYVSRLNFFFAEAFANFICNNVLSRDLSCSRLPVKIDC